MQKSNVFLSNSLAMLNHNRHYGAALNSKKCISNLQHANDQANQEITIKKIKNGSAKHRMFAVKAFIAAQCGSEINRNVMKKNK